jgi:hypothetical protein
MSPDQVVEVAPVGVLQQLLERLRHHRPAPDHRRIGVDQKTNRHRLNAVRLERLQRFAVLRFGPAGNAQHHRLRRSVDVGIEHADRCAFGSERQRQVDRRRRLAHAAFAAGNRNDVLDAGHQLDAALHSVRADAMADGHSDLADAGQRREMTLDQPA